MAVDKDKLRVAAFTIAATCFLALVISIRFVGQFLMKSRRKKSCYLTTESKPQYAFKRVLADNSYSQFKHLKLHAADSQSDEDYSNLHPYRGEISQLIKNPNVAFLEVLDGCEKGVLEMGDSYVWVETEAQLGELVEVLSNEKVFAVDTEQHSFRSFLGFTALIQISTIREDYLVDTIILHDVMGLLRPVFADPGICKVFHGADNDVLWLQRDFHIYVVNLFDTAKACDILSKPQRSLAYLLETYCSVATNKLLQREDWRQRPLPEEMIQYARTDAHYLLYIAYCLCLELKERNENSSPGDKFHFLLEASRRSNATCLQLFAKDIEACQGELAASSIVSRCLNDQGNISSSLCDDKELVRRLCLWRDIMARLHDESLRFVLSENAIIALAAQIPTDETDICSTISEADRDVESVALVPLQSPSSVVCCHLEDLLCLLQENTANLDNIFHRFIQQHLGPAGSCPLSAYNYALLSKTSLGVTYKSTSNRNGFRASKQIAKKASRELFVQKFSCKAPVYHNCKIYANDGRLLCYCDRRKLEWYLSRDLAKLVEQDPPSIMLLFEPKGRPEDEDNDFYIQSKKNICVGCGEGNHYLRYRIIPSCYRIHFPEHLKSHRSHDIVLLCVDCHEIAHAAAEKYKKQVAAEFGIPLFIRKVVDFDNTQHVPSSMPIVTSEEIGVSPLQLRTAAMALLRHGPEMPSQRRQELMQIVMTYYGGREISEEDLERALIVGMTPHEKRKFEKKRGFAFKHLTGGINLNDGKENNIGSKGTPSLQTALKGGSMDANMTLMNREQDVDTLMIEDRGGSTQPSSLNDGGNIVESTIDTDDVMSDLKIVEDDHISGNGILSNETTCSMHVGDVPLKHESKLSLLGHGPHGKQVVAHLLKEYGEDGIREFCQRWRQVFVEALHPRFLPAGWDVMHSGKRDFGEYSVYNPTKKASGVAAAG
ncbi:protein RRP6-like 3 isoform X2 [Sesamum indicum]|uniref:Protein RRP6-like 3 isoform X2 n=1 Tax=Sesamum indicum TaxID=4182 RepID=A0A6I9UFV3_SESIN|nr:protein RRP6-like 3 isoform X2 [Sesamum indicum]